MDVITGNIIIELNVYDESGVAKVELRFRDPQDPINRQGTQYVFTDTETPFQFLWNSAQLPDGRQRYDVYAWDIYGNGGDSYFASGFLAMNDPNYPPITLVTPTSGSVVSGSVPVEVTTSADYGIVEVDIYEEVPGEGFSKRLTVFKSAPYRYYWESANYPNGPHRFRVRSFENDRFSPGDLGDPGQLVFELCVRSCIASGTITGIIFSSTGAVVEGAKITLRVNNKNTTYTSDAQGKYTIPNLPPDTYTITYVAAGYSQQKTKATVTSGQTLVINVTLKPK